MKLFGWKKDQIINHVVYNTICQLKKKLGRPEMIKIVCKYSYRRTCSVYYIFFSFLQTFFINHLRIKIA